MEDIRTDSLSSLVSYRTFVRAVSGGAVSISLPSVWAIPCFKILCEWSTVLHAAVACWLIVSACRKICLPFSVVLVSMAGLQGFYIVAIIYKARKRKRNLLKPSSLSLKCFSFIIKVVCNIKWDVMFHTEANQLAVLFTFQLLTACCLCQHNACDFFGEACITVPCCELVCQLAAVARPTQLHWQKTYRRPQVFQKAVQEHSLSVQWYI